jgi:hypothetical protein
LGTETSGARLTRQQQWEYAVIFISCHGHYFEGIDAVILKNSKVVILTGGAGRA